MQIRFRLKVDLESWDLIFLDIVTSICETLTVCPLLDQKKERIKQKLDNIEQKWNKTEADLHMAQ